MKAILLVLCLAAIALASNEGRVVTDELIAEIKKAKTLHWVPGKGSPRANMPKSEARKYYGVLEGSDPECILQEKRFSEAQTVGAPASFDARKRWPNCPSMSQIRDQSDCGSCWAFGAAESMSDRFCIHLNTTFPINTALSTEDINSCASRCGSCEGGRPSCAYRYWVSTGVVTDDCYPYSLPGCDHHIPDSTNPCGQHGEYPTPKCERKCTGNKQKDFAKDKVFGSKAYTVRGERNMMTELSTHGPCEATISVYEDFEAYTGGIYHHVSGRYLGGHAIRILGYGEENGVKYWLMANSWNPKWGEGGYFRILRGSNECGVETEIYCGLAK